MRCGQRGGHRGRVPRDVRGRDGVVGVFVGGCRRCKGRKQTPAVSRKEMHYCSQVEVGGDQAHRRQRQVQPRQETETVR